MAELIDCTDIEVQFVAPLDCFAETDLERAGGKAANLGVLVRGGFPVPAGFVITTSAYDRFAARNALGGVIRRALQAPPGSGARIRASFEAAPIPPEVEDAILAAYEPLGQGPVAVRSSATAEDLPEAAFAGQQDTYLNVSGAEAVLDAVRRCWASLWTDRAIAYRDRLGIDQQTVKLAVVIQQMAPAEAAGVLFTANPVTGRRDEIVIYSNPGLGEAVVSGLVTPDHFVLRQGRRGWRITERRLGKHEVVIQARSGGGTAHQAGPAEDLPLPDQALHRLARLGAAIQSHFGAPQDIEWAWGDGKVFILQARPITALPSPPPRATRFHRILAQNFVEMLPVRPYPLDLETWVAALGSAVEPLFALMGLEWSFIRLFEIEDGVISRYTPNFPIPTWRTLLAPLRLVSLILRFNPVDWQSDPLLTGTIARARMLQAQELETLSWEQMLDMVDAAVEIPFLAAGEIRRRYLPGAAFAALRLRILLGVLGHSEKAGLLLTSAENKTVEMNQALEGLAGRIRSDPNLAQIFARRSPDALPSALAELPAGRAFLSELRSFFDRYGHRETIISSALEPAWKDSPEVVLGILKNFAAHPPRRPASQPKWRAAQEQILQHPLLRIGLLRSTYLRTFAKARTLVQIREDTHFNATLSLPIFRRVFLEMGRRLTGAGVLGSPEDVFHLRLSELKQVSGLPLPADLAAGLRETAARRKTARARLENTPLVDPRLFPPPAGGSAALLRGTAGSPGVAEGPVRIVRDMTEFDRLAVGEVLVAPYTNPSWTPLFQRAAAVVVDSGSPASHAAIVAREYGIPAVMATMTGTQSLHDGERVRVDGSRGAVYRVSPTPAEHLG